jgi:Fe(3+) dicitrate transport protein
MALRRAESGASRLRSAACGPRRGTVRPRSGVAGVAGFAVLFFVSMTSEGQSQQLPAAPDTVVGAGVVAPQAVVALPAVEVIGRSAADVRTILGAAHVVTARAIDAARPLSGNEVLRRVPGVHVQDEDHFGLNLNIGVRGLTPRRSSRVLLLEDGMPIHLGPYSDPTAHYQPPVEGVERIEVLTGSGQILYGPQTVGGVINYVRTPLPDARGGVAWLSAGSRGLFGSHLRVGGARGDAAASLEYTRRQGDGSRDGWRHAIDDVVARGALRLRGEQRLTLKAGVYNEASRFGESGLTEAEFRADPFGNPSPNDVFDLRRYAAQAVHEVPLFQGAALSTHLYGQHVHRASWRQASSSSDRFGTPGYGSRFACAAGATGLDGCGNQGRPRTYRFVGVEPRLGVERMLGAVASRTEVGVRAHVESVERRQFTGATPGARSGEMTRDNLLETTALSAYLRTSLAAGPWSVTPGLRLEDVRSRNTNRMQDASQRDHYAELLPGVGAAFNGIRVTTLFAGAHRGFAPPRPADILNPRPGEGLVQVDPELSWNYEVGLRSDPMHGLHFQATFFHIDFGNQVVEGGLAGGGARFVNAGRTVHAGAEAAVAFDLAAATGTRSLPYLEVGYTRLVHAAFRSDLLSSVDGGTPVRDRRLPYAPRYLLDAGAGFRDLAGFGLHLRAASVGDQFSDDLNSVASTADGQRGLLPAYTVYDLSVSRDVARASATVFLAAKNLRDTVYITERLEGIMVGMPRTVQAGLRWEF